MADFNMVSLAKIVGSRLDITTAVESGTFEGSTTKLLADSGYFKLVHSIELSSQRWRKACDVLQHPRIQLHYGSSSIWVPVLARVYRDRPLFWYLDAHWFGKEHGSAGTWDLPVAGKDQFPLWKELGAIKERKWPDIVVVDDVHAFGRTDLEDSVWHNVSKQALDQVLEGRYERSEIIGDQYVAWLRPAT
jgi:hypothetical protein